MRQHLPYLSEHRYEINIHPLFPIDSTSNMLLGEGSKLHKTGDSSDVEEEDDGEIAITPLGVPLLAGPGTIATAMNYSVDGGWTEILVTISGFGIFCFSILSCLVVLSLC